MGRMKVGLALGGGGARGLAHIPMLEVFDELGVRPHCITGTSIGAIMGALYASGISGARIRAGVARMVVTKGDGFRRALEKRDALKWVGFFDLNFGPGGLFKGDRFMDFLYQSLRVATFKELAIPLRLVATDFWTAEQVVMDSGPLLSAVKASMGLPGVFTPVQRGGRVLVDGGGVNPLPHDLLTDCDVVVAVDVMGRMTAPGRRVPGMYRAVMGVFDTMQKTIIAEKAKASPPDILVRPDIVDVDLLEFYKADQIFEQAEPARRKLKRALERILAG